MSATETMIAALPPSLRVVDRDQAAAIIGLSVRSLDAMTAEGNGPRVLRLGRRVLYRLSDLESWLADRANGVE